MQTRDKCRQSHPSTGTTPIIPNTHCYVYTPERQTCLHTDPLWAPGNRGGRKERQLLTANFATRVMKRWGESIQGVSPPLFTHSGSYCMILWSRAKQLIKILSKSPYGQVQYPVSFYKCKMCHNIPLQMQNYGATEMPPAYKSYSNHILQT